jgi:transposase
MPGLDPLSLLPPGLIFEAVEVTADTITIDARGDSGEGHCPSCGTGSALVHSLHRRKVLDLPAHGRAVELHVQTRRLRCDERDCPRQTFTEPLSPSITGGTGRRTARLDSLLGDLGRSLGGRPAVAVARRLMLPVGVDTLLRTLRRRAVQDQAPAQVIGIDEWAWRRRQRYGTLICDLERRQVIDLLPDREPATVRAWLSRHPEVRVVARDRAGGYAAAVADAAPAALQVADRWHLMENASAAFLQAVRSVLGSIRRALGASTVDPDLLSAAERLQYEGYQRRHAENEAIRAMAEAGVGIKDITRRTGRSRKLVRAVLRNTEDEVFRSRAGSLAPWLIALETAWTEGCNNGAELWRGLRAEGFAGSLRVVGEWATRRRRSERADGAVASRLPPARTIAHAMLVRRDRLTRAEATMVASVEAGVPALAAARDLVDEFHHMVRTRTPAPLQGWIARAVASMVAAFGRGIAADGAAVRAALTEPWSNGPTEGCITRLKLIRRQMYGRGKLDLLRARLVAQP